MSVPSQWTMDILRRAAFVFALTVCVAGTSYAQNIAPFDRLAGQWSGSGTIDLSNGAHESIRCRAAYDVLNDQRKLQLNIRCASESFNFDLRASANYSGGTITGNWSESTRNVAGTISGKLFEFNYRLASATYVVTLNPLQPMDGTQTAVGTFENPAGGEPYQFAGVAE